MNKIKSTAILIKDTAHSEFFIRRAVPFVRRYEAPIITIASERYLKNVEISATPPFLFLNT